MAPSLKQLTLNFLDRILRSGGYAGGGNTFFGDLSYNPTSSGISVTHDSALTFSAYWASVRLLTGTVATLPCLTYSRMERGKQRAPEHPLYPLLHDEPNPEMDIVSFMETYMLHLITGGNGYALIDWEERTTVKAIWIMNPDKVTVSRDPATKAIIYSYSIDGVGQVNIPSYRVWHTPGLGYDGLIGYSPLRMAAETIGMGLAARKSGAKLFANGMRVGGYMEHPGKMSDTAQKNFKKAIADQHEGLDNWHRLLILEEGMKYNKAIIPPEEAQMMETMNFSIRDMARFFLIQPHKIGDMERATFGNIEEQNIEFVVDTLRYWLVKLEKSAKRKLLLPSEKSDYFIEFLVDALIRGDLESRYRAHAIGRNWGWESANDVLEMENRNGIGAQGDIYMAPANMIPADQFNAQMPDRPAKPNQTTGGA